MYAIWWRWQNIHTSQWMDCIQRLGANQNCGCWFFLFTLQMNDFRILMGVCKRDDMLCYNGCGHKFDISYPIFPVCCLSCACFCIHVSQYNHEIQDSTLSLCMCVYAWQLWLYQRDSSLCSMFMHIKWFSNQSHWHSISNWFYVRFRNFAFIWKKKSLQFSYKNIWMKNRNCPIYQSATYDNFFLLTKRLQYWEWI